MKTYCKKISSNNKGYFYTLESLIGITIIVVSLVVILGIAQVPASSGVSLVKRQGIEALEFLDQKGELRFLVHSGNEIQLNDRLKDILPPTISLYTDICTNTCMGEIPADRTVVSVDYYISGYNDLFFIKKVKLWMWGSF